MKIGTRILLYTIEEGGEAVKKRFAKFLEETALHVRITLANISVR